MGRRLEDERSCVTNEFLDTQSVPQSLEPIFNL